ncbi:MAG: FAD-binding oxidoreductase [Planctomycetota bacterium]
MPSNPTLPLQLDCNDVHSRLNPVRVAQIRYPESTEDVQRAVREAAAADLPVSICGHRHAMGGQQFGEGTLLLDLTRLKTMGPIDRVHRWVEVGAGMHWPDLLAGLHAQQTEEAEFLTFRQKQTGADHLTLGGALAANAHGRGLSMRPFIEDVEAFTLIDAQGEARRCSRTENAEWFHLAIGGYGCFGVITSVCLRLVPRTTVRREVALSTIADALAQLEERRGAGCQYGDFQFAVDETSPDFLHRGILATYRPVPEADPGPSTRDLSEDDWRELIELAHTDRAAAFRRYSAHYLASHGALYGSDSHQMGVYLDDYHLDLDRRLGTCPGSEMISELYVPRQHLVAFMARVAKELRARKVTVIYGTVRLILKDGESFLAWAREDFACVIFNLHVDHDEQGRERAAEAFRMLIDAALSFGGSYFLTYHRWARRDQVLGAYPQLPEFLRAKRRLDPELRFQSEWWRHYERVL